MLSNNSIGLKIKSIREEKGLSQKKVIEKLAKREIHMSRETLSKIETNNRTISAVEVNVLCNVLGIDLSSLFPDEEKDDLVTLFRERSGFSDETIEEIEILQDMLKIFLSQKEIYEGAYKTPDRKPLWKEILN